MSVLARSVAAERTELCARPLYGPMARVISVDWRREPSLCVETYRSGHPAGGLYIAQRFIGIVAEALIRLRETTFVGVVGAVPLRNGAAIEIAVGARGPVRHIEMALAWPDGGRARRTVLDDDAELAALDAALDLLAGAP